MSIEVPGSKHINWLLIACKVQPNISETHNFTKTIETCSEINNSIHYRQNIHENNNNKKQIAEHFLDVSNDKKHLMRTKLNTSVDIKVLMIELFDMF